MDSNNKSEIAVCVESVVKRFGEQASPVLVLDRVSLEIRHNEFFTLLGPSGCGKTTLLRIIAGLEELTSGAVFLYSKEIGRLPPNKRPVNTVFQQYALFPHMSVADNVAFGLRRLRQPENVVQRRVSEVLALVQLSELAARRPSQLSGGQQQRVALARALAPSPKLLLLDEPLSALDLKLRQAMRVELKQLQEETGITFIFVTHDQDEALTMSDRVAVMSAGRIQQVGTPSEVYERPANRFVAEFIGDTNLLEVTVKSLTSNGLVECVTTDGLCLSATPDRAATIGQKAYVSIRPEKVSLVPQAGRNGLVPCVVERQIYLGTDTQFMVRLDGGTEMMVRSQNAHGHVIDLRPGAAAGLKFAPEAARLLLD